MCARKFAEALHKYSNLLHIISTYPNVSLNYAAIISSVEFSFLGQLQTHIQCNWCNRILCSCSSSGGLFVCNRNCSNE